MFNLYVTVYTNTSHEQKTKYNCNLPQFFTSLAEGTNKPFVVIFRKQSCVELLCW